MSTNSIVVVVMMLQASAAGLREPCLSDAQTRCHARPRLRGGAGNSGLRKGFSGDVQLSATGNTLADIVENARGPLQISCDGQHCYSWADAAAVVSPDKLEVVGMASGAILAGQWFLMEGSNGKFCNVTLVHRCLVDRQHLELRVDMLIVGGQACHASRERNDRFLPLGSCLQSNPLDPVEWHDVVACPFFCTWMDAQQLFRSTHSLRVGRRSTVGGVHPESFGAAQGLPIHYTPSRSTIDAIHSQVDQKETDDSS